MLHALLNHVQMEIKGTQEPNDDTSQKDNSKGSLQETFGFIPQES